MSFDLEFFQEQEQEQMRIESEAERLWMLESAIRECLTKGVSLESIKTICFESGCSYSRVVGEVQTGETSE